MYLNNLIIKNYRSIKEIKLDFKKWKNIIVWRNNAWKSNIIKALDLVLWESSPTYAKSENITIDDFYIDNNWIQTDEIIIMCVLKYEETDSIDFSKITWSWFYSKNIKNPIIWWKEFNAFFNIWVLSGNINDFINKTFIDVKYEKWLPYVKNENNNFNIHFNKKDFIFILKVNKESDKTIKKEMKMLFWNLSNINTFQVSSYEIWRNDLLQSAILPSFRSPSEQLRLSNYSWYWKLMKKLVEKIDIWNEIQKQFEEIWKLCNEKFAEIQWEIKGSCLEVAFPWTDLSFQFWYNKSHDVYKNAKLFINDWIDWKLEDKWSWIQSAIIIWLFQYYTTEFNSNNGSLLCIEEPELFLHPHWRRSISNRLDEFLWNKNTDNQLIITTHSTEFINTISQNINIIRLDKKDWIWTKWRNIDIQNLKKYLVDGNYNEIFFADKVIFCEWNDKYLIDLLFKKVLNDNNISVINVWWKENFNEFIEISIKIWINAYIVADFDYLLRDNQSKIEWFKEYREDISTLPDKFLKNRFRCDFDNIKKEITDLRKTIKETDKKFFYTWKKIDWLVFETYYDDLLKLLNKLREKWIFILNWEIEDLIIDKNLLIDEKFKLGSIFKINEKLNNWESIESIINTSTIKDIKNLI